LELLTQRATDMAGVKTSEDFNKLQVSGDLEAALEGLSAEQLAAVYSIDDSLAATSAYRRKLVGRKGRGGALRRVARKSGGVQEILAAAGLGDIGFTGDAGEFRARLEKIISGGKTQGLDKDEIDAIAQELLNVKNREIFSRAGKEEASTQVSEADIAKSLQSLSENSLRATQILADLAAGRPIGTTAAGSSK